METKGSHITHNTNAEALLPDIKRMYDKQKLFNILTSQHTNRHLKKIMDIAGIKKRISFHCGRHTFATLCKNYGMNYEVIAKYLGHMDKRTTMVYAKYEIDFLFSEMEKWS